MSDKKENNGWSTTTNKTDSIYSTTTNDNAWTDITTTPNDQHQYVMTTNNSAPYTVSSWPQSPEEPHVWKNYYIKYSVSKHGKRFNVKFNETKHFSNLNESDIKDKMSELFKSYYLKYLLSNSEERKSLLRSDKVLNDDIQANDNSTVYISFEPTEEVIKLRENGKNVTKTEFQEVTINNESVLAENDATLITDYMLDFFIRNSLPKVVK